MAWGYNVNGQLGDGTKIQRTSPVAVNGLSSGVMAVSGGLYHSLALKSDGSVWAWGYNLDGELGDGTQVDKSAPVPVSGLSSGVVAVAAGWIHSLALKSDGSVWAWGYNGSGDLGDGTQTSRSTPVAVIGLSSGVVAVSGGGNHNLALKSDGSVWAWGFNGFGQLGDGTTIDRLSAVAVTGLGSGSGVVAVSAGGYHSMALKSDGSVWAWGNNGDGELGDGTTTNSSSPIAVGGLGSGVVAVAAGGYHNLALKSDGSVWAWGNNGDGELGDGTTTSSSSPIAVSGLAGGVAAVAAGGYHSIARKSDGSVWDWGSNQHGQLGNGTVTNRYAPVAVSGLANGAVSIAGGGYHSLVIISLADSGISASGKSFTSSEGHSFGGVVAQFNDPDSAATASEYSANIAWGDQTTSAGAVSGAAGAFTVSGSHTYAEEGTQTVTVTVKDSDNPSNVATATSTSTVADAALAANCSAPPTSPTSFSGATAKFMDADPKGIASDYTASINWGDASSSAGTISGPAGGAFTVSAKHSYKSTGLMTVTTSIGDAGGSKTSRVCKVLVFAFAPGRGAFVIGDRENVLGATVTFWSARWWKLNRLSGGRAPARFKGFADSPATPACGVSWLGDQGNSAPPPPAGTLPAFMAVIVTSSATRSGGETTGNTVHIVVVRTNPGYRPNLGHPGTGTVVAQVC